MRPCSRCATCSIGSSGRPAGRPHLDVLHPARRFWGGPDNSLIALEAQLLGAMRAGDVPGFEIPSRYFQFVRSGDARTAGSGPRAQPARPAVARRPDGASPGSGPAGSGGDRRRAGGARARPRLRARRVRRARAARRINARSWWARAPAGRVIRIDALRSLALASSPRPAVRRRRSAAGSSCSRGPGVRGASFARRARRWPSITNIASAIWRWRRRLR